MGNDEDSSERNSRFQNCPKRSGLPSHAIDRGSPPVIAPSLSRTTPVPSPRGVLNHAEYLPFSSIDQVLTLKVVLPQLVTQMLGFPEVNGMVTRRLRPLPIRPRNNRSSAIFWMALVAFCKRPLCATSSLSNIRWNEFSAYWVHNLAALFVFQAASDALHKNNCCSFD